MTDDEIKRYEEIGATKNLPKEYFELLEEVKRLSMPAQVVAEDLEDHWQVRVNGVPVVRCFTEEEAEAVYEAFEEALGSSQREHEEESVSKNQAN